jgi:hypothetical protein
MLGKGLLHCPSANSPPSGVHFVVVGGLVWSKDPKSCVGGSFDTGRVSHTGLVEGDDTDYERHPQPQGVKCGRKVLTKFSCIPELLHYAFIS